MASWRLAITDAVSEADLAEIMRELVALAKQGDVGAAKLVLQYAVGKPAAVAEPDRMEIEEWNLHKESVVMGNDMELIRVGASAKVGNMLANVARLLNDETAITGMQKMSLESGKQPDTRGEANADAGSPGVPRAARPPVRADGSRRAGHTVGQAARSTSRASNETDAAGDFDPRDQEWLEILGRRPVGMANGERVAGPSNARGNGAARPSKSKSNGGARNDHAGSDRTSNPHGKTTDDRSESASNGRAAG